MFFWLTVTDIACVYPIFTSSGVGICPRYYLFLGLSMCTLSLTCDSHRQEQREYVMKSIELQTVGDGSPVKNHQQKPRWSATCSACLDLLNIIYLKICCRIWASELWTSIVSIWRFSMLYTLKWLNKNFQSMKVFVHKFYSPGIPQLIVFIVLFCVRTIVVARIYQQQIQGTLLLNGMNHLRRNSTGKPQILTLKIQHVGKNL